MLSLPIFAQISSAAIAASLTASLTYGHYTVTSGPAGSGLMPPASILRPEAGAGARLDPVAELFLAFAALKLEKAKAERNRAMVDWLIGLQTGFGPADLKVQRFDAGLVYTVRYATGDEAGHVLQDLVAVPYGPEMPFAVSLMTAPDGTLQVEGASCTALRTLEVLDAAAGPEAAEAEALSQAEAYLAAPDAADLSLPADCLTVLLKRR